MKIIKNKHRSVKASRTRRTIRAAQEQYKFIKSKSVYDSDGFLTDYTLYSTSDGETYFCMFGDNEVYEPDLDYADWEGDSYEEAMEWFDSYNGFEDELDEDPDDWYNRRNGINAAEENAEIDDEANEDMGFFKHNQKYSSKNTATNWKYNRVPALFKMIDFPSGAVVLDYGGGTKESEALAKGYFGENYPDVKYVYYDKYWQNGKEQNASLREVKQNGGADIAMLSNVLNTIAEPEVRQDVLTHVKSLLKPDGVLYIYGYQGKKEDQEGGGRTTGDDQYQTFMKTKDYIPEISEVFPNAKYTGGMIVAPNDGGRVAASRRRNNDLVVL